MSKQKLIMKLDVIDLDQCIQRNVVFKTISNPDSNATKANERKNNNNPYIEQITLNELKNTNSNNSYKTQLNCNINNKVNVISINTKFCKDALTPTIDSEVVIENMNQIGTKEDNIEKVKNLIAKCEKSAPIDIDVISISSDEDSSVVNDVNAKLLNTISKKCDNNDLKYNSDCSYNSSDFEFITEDEAISEGIISNSASTYQYRPAEFAPVTSQPLSSRSSNSSLKCTSKHNTYNRINSGLFQENNPNKFNKKQTTLNMVEAVPSCSNSSNLYPKSIRPGSNLCNNLKDSSSSGLSNIFKNDHPVHNEVPDREKYFNLFRGNYSSALTLCDIHVMENKSFRTTRMHIEFEGIGFDLRLMRNMNSSSQDEFEEEAEDNVKKILQMYPGDNRKRRRRH